MPPRDFAQTPCEGNKLPYLTFEQREQSLKQNLTLTFRMCHNEIIRILIIVDFVFDDVATYFRDTFFRH